MRVKLFVNSKNGIYLALASNYCSCMKHGHALCFLCCIFHLVAISPLLPAAEQGPGPKAESFDLKNIRLLDGPFKEAMQRDAAYILSLEPDRLLHSFLLTAGLLSGGVFLAVCADIAHSEHKGYKEQQNP